MESVRATVVEGKEAATEKMTMVKDTVVEKVYSGFYFTLCSGCNWRKPGSNEGEDEHLVWLCHLWQGRV